MTGPGIDYGHGTTNIDQATGIRYGIISRNSVAPEAMDDVYSNGDDLSFEQAKDDLQTHLQAALYQVLATYALSKERAKDIAQQAAESLVDDVAGDAIGDIDNPVYGYTKDGYDLRTCSDNDLFVLKSPFYTYARYCSPCVPGAGNLDDAMTWDILGPSDDMAATEVLAAQLGVKCYALGPDWFDDDNPCPYPTWPVQQSEKK